MTNHSLVAETVTAHPGLEQKAIAKLCVVDTPSIGSALNTALANGLIEKRGKLYYPIIQCPNCDKFRHALWVPA